MVKKDKCLAFLHRDEIILQPVIYILLHVIGRVVFAVGGNNDTMRVAGIERIPCRATDRFIKFFIIVASHQAVVACIVVDRAVHCLCIHNPTVYCGSRLVADVPGISQKSRLFVLHILLQVGDPTPHSSGYLRVGDVDKGVFSGPSPFAFSHYRTITSPVLLDREIGLLYLESGRCSNVGKSGSLGSR